MTTLTKMTPINKHSVLKIARQTGKWTGYISASNVNSFHIKGGWNLGIRFEIVYRDGNYYHVYNEQEVPLNNALNGFKFYNCNPELGQRIRFWTEKPQ